MRAEAPAAAKDEADLTMAACRVEPGQAGQASRTPRGGASRRARCTIGSTLLLGAWGLLIDMRKQARRLWLGDWHRDDEAAAVAADPDQDEIVLLTPSDDGDPPPAEPRRNVRRGVAAAAAIAVLCALGIALLSSGGSNNKPLAADTAQSPPAQAPQTQVPQTPQGPQQGFGAPNLTGAAATKAAQAAVAKFPGNVERVTRGPTGGGYVVHVIQGDGNEVHVLVDPHFKVRGSDAGSAAQGFGPGTSQ
ncbi:MAG: hypothetical protein QOC55_364 [Thermoleophilaceae bacterium]|nr:hypothetical protein [Thermoleophilaceae bacterium]